MQRNEIYEKLKALENKLNTSLLEIEKRFVVLEEHSPEKLEERIKELEDLQMLNDLEIIKIKEKLKDMEVKEDSKKDVDFEELRKLKDEIEDTLKKRIIIEKKFKEIEEKLKGIELFSRHELKEEKIKSMSRQIYMLRKRIDSIENIKNGLEETRLSFQDLLNKLNIAMKEFVAMKKEIEIYKSTTLRDLKNEIEKIKSIIEKRDANFIEKKIESKVMGYLNENLKNLAKTIDKRIPELVEDSESIARLFSKYKLELNEMKKYITYLQHEIEILKTRISHVVE